MDGQMKMQNNIMKAYLWAFVNFEQNDWARFFPIAEFAYNNAKNISIVSIFFKLNCKYQPRVSYKKDLDPCLKSKIVKKPSFKL